MFAMRVHSDNDTRVHNRFTSTQNEIIGHAADGIAEHRPDLGHIIKNTSGESFTLRDEDTSFCGKGLLENGRILSIMADTRHAITEYHDHLGDPDERKKGIDQIMGIIPHHCGDHSKCVYPEHCRYLSIKKDNPDMTEEEVLQKLAETSLCHGGTCMDLSEDGSEQLKNVLIKRFNSKSIDRIAEMAWSNTCMGFWGTVTKFSEGKQLNLDQTDYWFLMLEYCFC